MMQYIRSNVACVRVFLGVVLPSILTGLLGPALQPLASRRMGM
jgi:hypothetical protein